MDDAAGAVVPQGGAGLLSEHAGPRLRTVDEHQFRTSRRDSSRVFTAAGLRLVAVVTRTDREDASLVDAAERYAEEMWRRLCPDEAEPSLFIAHQLLGERDLDFRQFGSVAAGRGSVKAMLDAGMRRTLVAYWDRPDRSSGVL
ncbi:hypothetical protein [Micromonospora sp. NBC_00858]|uniref:hypothetical protein n=1 Tax=Micromonospora sp. NBC_00858 TaxID=2975979 RepID=UPI00386B968A|nr:hypothetical protein OG990_10435 [Micromonospora sp. NBC_00858]